MYGAFNSLRYGSRHDWLCALALIGLLLRALVPVGFMPAPVHGEVRLVLCSAAGINASHQVPEPHGVSDHLPCLFAASCAAAAPAPAQLTVKLLFLGSSSPESSYRSPPSAAPARHTAARGPPILV
jgi:hypothetical protein